MPAFQPAPPAEGLYYPSGASALGNGTYSAAGLTEGPADLYAFEVGDYAYASMFPIPHIELTLFTFAVGTVNITVYRTAKSRTMPVRGQINVYAVGGRNVVDWEAPFGIPLTYRAEQFDIDGNSLGYTAAFSTILDVSDTWIHNPFDPIHGIAVKMTADAGATLPSPTPTDVYYAAGSGLGIGISGQRHGLVDTPASFLTFTEDDADAARSMFGDPYNGPSVPPVLVIRTGSGQNIRYPQPFFALIPDPVETPLNTQVGEHVTRWECSATEIAPPAPALVAAVLTYADIDATYSTWAAADAAYSSYLERDRDYSLAGTAETETP